MQNSNQDHENTLYAFKELLYLHYSKKRYAFNDSMITVARKSPDRSLLASAYITRGMLYNDDKNYQKALNCYVTANDIIIPAQDHYLRYKIKYAMAQLKYLIGRHSEAIKLFRECCIYFEKEQESKAYVNALHALGMCYLRTQEYKLGAQVNEIGIKESVSQGFGNMIPYFIHSEALNQYFQGNYDQAVSKLKSVEAFLVYKKDYANKSVSDFHIGKSYQKQQNMNEAIKYFMKVDTAFRVHGVLRRDYPEAYKILIDYYRKKKDKDLQILYTDSLLRTDSLLDADQEFVSVRLSSGYDHKVLADDNRQLKDSLNKRSIAFLGLLPTVVLIVVFQVFKNHKNKKVQEAL